ncbi:hypothetical protein O181_007371 [Austropuccinia psidii MF-1]|uniref:Integrase catalytic domain-containing protein n=1 Tax=Austropuccinia psidii MF-1 TaxID=1389203 RepID=A0A9Q3BKP4_9BASI|nr:hypothetical protein [Austropuccinia psidii MF-1]
MDYGGAFTSNNIKNFLKKSGIQSTLTKPNSPHQNPFSERGNSFLLEQTRCLLLDLGVPHLWWGEAISTATYLLNRTHIASLTFKTPYQLEYSKQHFNNPTDNNTPCTAINVNPEVGCFNDMHPSSSLEHSTLEIEANQFVAEYPEPKTKYILLFWK